MIKPIRQKHVVIACLAALVVTGLSLAPAAFAEHRAPEATASVHIAAAASESAAGTAVPKNRITPPAVTADEALMLRSAGGLSLSKAEILASDAEILYMQAVPHETLPAVSGEDEAAAAGETAADNTAAAPDPAGDLRSQIVNFALQFVGCPYAYGGNSLSEGTDCSGFTSLVYAAFGIPIERSSYAQRDNGIAVSWEEALPGDIICYEGHVALYIGNGAIVHASDETTGIIVTPDAWYRPIVTVRRIIP